MRKAVVIGALSLETLLGCGYTEFPQYSGRYELQEIVYSDPSLVGEKQFPFTLEVVDRMEHLGSHWYHHLHFHFIAETEEQAEGAFTLKLDDLSRIDQGTWPNDWYDGVEVHHEPKVYGTGAFCNSQYLYFLYLGTEPSVEIIKNVYPGRGEYLGEDPTTKMPLYESLARPEEVDFDDAGWYEAIEKNQGATLSFTFFRHRRIDVPGWEDGYKDCILPSDSRRSGSVSFIYRAQIDHLNDETDIRKAGISDTKNGLPSLYFFRKVIPDIQ